jgi:hypothetical protein
MTFAADANLLPATCSQQCVEDSEMWSKLGVVSRFAAGKMTVPVWHTFWLSA